MKKIILTKKRLSQLNTQISIDEILYEKFRRMNQDLNKKIAAWNRKKRVVRVYKKINKNVFMEVLVVKETKTPDGVIIEIV